ncbi:MAG: beta-galactosidase [Pseudomonadota bacterium]
MATAFAASSLPKISQAADARDNAGATHHFSIGETDFLLNGKRLQIRCGEIHFARVPREYWQHRLKAIKAMGLNVVCAYLFWNYHEWHEGQYDWQGQRDAAEFCRLAQQEGLWVILRPGPYACAEWEMGGLPWWLLKHEGNFLRSNDARFIEPAARWLREVGRVLGPVQITQGGPILMVQVENEYGFFGSDLAYMRLMRKIMLYAGFDVPLFACNPTNAVVRSHIPELFSVANFGANPEQGFKALAEVQKGPLMCGEFYPGWFDTWGTPHKRGDIGKVMRDLDYMLKVNGSFSLYMAHGGTSFGLWAGCDRPMRPDTSSYDYDAPISEAGWMGDKFAQFRATITPHLLPGETMAEAPTANPVISIPAFKLTETAAVMANLPGAVIHAVSPLAIEHYDISRGLIAYATTLPAGPDGVLDAALVRDLAWVFIDGKAAGVMDARSRRFRVNLPARTRPVKLEILLYTIARVNFGIEMHDRKGLHGPVHFIPRTGSSSSLEKQLINNWEIRALDFGADARLPALNWQPIVSDKFASADVMKPAFWRGSFSVTTVGDTFLDVSSWGMGAVWVNGICLGRFWNIGPTQTMYLPGPWLKAGRNEIIVLDLLGPDRNEIAGLKLPVLDQLRPEKDFFPRNNRGQLTLAGLLPVHEGSFSAGSAQQEIRFAKPAFGKQFCLESLDDFDGKGFAAIAEIELFDHDGKIMSQATWTIAYADSEESVREDGSALNAINGQASDHWHTALNGKIALPHPHRLVIDLGSKSGVNGFRYTPRQGSDDATGRIKTYRIFIGESLVSAVN